MILKLITLFLRYRGAKSPEFGMRLNNKRFNEYDSKEVYRAKLILEFYQELK